MPFLYENLEAYSVHRQRYDAVVIAVTMTEYHLATCGFTRKRSIYER
jgi:hypothetical protein